MFMSGKEQLNRLLEPEDYFEMLNEVLEAPIDGFDASRLYGILRGFCEGLTSDLSFSNLFSRLDYVCHHHTVSRSLHISIQRLRYRLHSAQDSYRDAASRKDDVALLAFFIASVCRVSVPSSLCGMKEKLTVLAPSGSGQTRRLCMRVLVRSMDRHYISAVRDDGEGGEQIRIDYINAGFEKEYACLYDVLQEGMLLNLLKVRVDEDGIYIPLAIVVCPDYLLDVSSLSLCFKFYGHDERNYILSRIEPRQETPAMMLGNIAGLFLDDWVYEREEGQVSYPASVRRAFHIYPVSLSLLDMEEADFREEAPRQFSNIRHLVKEVMEQKYGFVLDKALVEPSFICEALGLSGRMDYLQDDFRKVIEQKSGRLDERRHSHQESHYIQMMLYSKMLEYNAHIPESQCEAYLFYSRYSDGFFQEKIYHKLLHEALSLRNKIVLQELRCAEGGVESVLGELQADELNKTRSPWAQKHLTGILSPFHSVELRSGKSLAAAYFFRFYTFLCKEQVLGKMGKPGVAGGSFSDLWNVPYHTRLQNGDMYARLKLAACEESGDGKGRGVDRLVFCPDPEGDAPSANFRVGDVVLAYAYPESTVPDVRNGYVMRGRLAEIGCDRLVVELVHGQRNVSVLRKEGCWYALEHDYIESSHENLYKGLYALLDVESSRRDLILGERLPCFTEDVPLIGSYGEFDELVRKERSAKDYFLVIGPPGSGKTNCALRYMVEEELRAGKSRILLLAYTNRAVDELCGMLETLCAECPELLSDYVRIGSGVTTAEQYRQRLLLERCGDLGTAAAVRSMLERNRVYVATVTTMSSQTLLLGRLSFDVAFIDEASQILEPCLLNLLCAAHDGECAVRRFVLIGDQKQLPAVVVQSVRDSEVSDDRLRRIGLKNCRNSLFERLLWLQRQRDNTRAFHLLRRQGRMHPEVYSFVNKAFYENQLECVPVRHQLLPLNQLYAHSDVRELKGWEKMLASHRMSFIHCHLEEKTGNDKVNRKEACIVARIIEAYTRLVRKEDKEICPDDIGVIVPYRSQISMIRNQLESSGYAYTDKISIDTVERYQGSQRNLIIYSCTVSRPYQLDFLSSSAYEERSEKGVYWVDRKLNVALTRAREQMVVVGDADLLSRNTIYRSLIEEMKQRDGYIGEEEVEAL